jgi:nicotinamidase/pyrazinamidase
MDLKKFLTKGDGLLIIDVQNDFCPDGALPIMGGDQVVPLLNRWIEAAQEKRIPIYASCDWHPMRHPSFKAEGGKWPAHCIAGTKGAAFHQDLKLPDDIVQITKGVRFDQDQNSAFDQTGLTALLRRDHVNRLWVGGLALDVCVLATVLDALQEGFRISVILEATRPVSLEGGRQAVIKMREAGAEIFAT